MVLAIINRDPELLLDMQGKVREMEQPFAPDWAFLNEAGTIGIKGYHHHYNNGNSTLRSLLSKALRIFVA